MKIIKKIKERINVWKKMNERKERKAKKKLRKSLR